MFVEMWAKDDKVNFLSEFLACQYFESFGGFYFNKKSVLQYCTFVNVLLKNVLCSDV